MIISALKNLAVVVGVAMVSSLAIATSAAAQNFTISPMVTIIEASGGQAKGSITINNQGKEPLRMRVYAEDFTYDRYKGFVITGKHDRSAIPYLQFSPRELVIPPGVTRNVRVSTILPPSIPDREYRAVIFVEDLKERDLKGSNDNVVAIKTRVASVFYTSKGATNADIQIGQAIWDDAAKKLNIVIKNNGKQSSYPDISWRIQQAGKEIIQDKLRGVLIQSESDREITLSTNNTPVSLASGNYTLSGEITSGIKKSTPFQVNVSIP